MSVQAPTKLRKERSTVHYSQYIRTENQPEEPAEKPADPAESTETEESK